MARQRSIMPPNYSIYWNNTLQFLDILVIDKANILAAIDAETAMKLYHHRLSGHAHRAALFLSLVGVDCDLVAVDLAAAQQKSPDFLKLNIFGQIPVLDDDGVIIPDSNAILIYVATKFGRRDWWPEDALGQARVQRWLSVAAGPLAFGPAAARLITLFGATFNSEEVIARAHALLTRLEGELAGRDWITLGRPTLADVALYSYVARAPEGNVDLSPYIHVRAWLNRVEALPRFLPFASSPVGMAA
jgi:glutathione S-transferase